MGRTTNQRRHRLAFFFQETDTYIEAVTAELARSERLDDTSCSGTGRRGKSHRRERTCRNGDFPEIHDLTVAKLAIGRDKDLDFLKGVVRLGLVDQQTLTSRYRQAPKLLMTGWWLGLLRSMTPSNRTNKSTTTTAANEDCICDNAELAEQPFSMPSLARGGEASSGPLHDQIWHNVLRDVQTQMLSHARHWLGDENPGAVADGLLAFFGATAPDVGHTAT